MQSALRTASGFVSDARDLLGATEHLGGHNGTHSLASYFLLGRSIELSLKAFLLMRGMKAWTLGSRAYGHDLMALLDRAKAKGLYRRTLTTPLNEKLIALLNREYISNRLSYRAAGERYRLPAFQECRDLCDRLVSGMEVHLANASSSA